MASTDELLVVLNRNSEDVGLGFSLLGKPGLPPIIYNILEDSPAAESGEVEVGDVILKVNETDVNRFTTKEVLKCLRLSSDPVTLKIKRDPKIKATVWKHLVSSSTRENSKIPNHNSKNGTTTSVLRNNHFASGIPTSKFYPPPNCINNHHHHHTNNNNNNNNNSNNNNHNNNISGPALCSNGITAPSSGDANSTGSILSSKKIECISGGGGKGAVDARDDNDDDENDDVVDLGVAMTNSKCHVKQSKQPKFEAFMMTGEHILNISRIPQSTNARITPKKWKKIDNMNNHTNHLRHHQQFYFSSLPNSPNEQEMGLKSADAAPSTNYTTNNSNTNTVMTSSSSSSAILDGNIADIEDEDDDNDHMSGCIQNTNIAPIPLVNNNNNSNNNSASFVRTSRSEDQLQQVRSSSSEGGGSGQAPYEQQSPGMCDVDDDVTSSLNTLLLETRGGGDSDSDRIVWTYNAPLTAAQQNMGSSHSTTSSSSPSPLHSVSPPSPTTSVSSSVMSSSQSTASSCRPHSTSAARQPHRPQTVAAHHPHHHPPHPGGGDFSVSEAISNISSPDYHEDEISVGINDILLMGIGSDHSDSDSTLLEQRAPRDHRIVIQVKGPMADRRPSCDNNSNSLNNNHNHTSKESSNTVDQSYHNELEDDVVSRSSSEDDSDVDSLHSFHYSPKAVDLPSAERLARRLFTLDGFKKSDVSRHLSKNNDFSRAVAEEYLKYFVFDKDTLDIALRKFLKQFSLAGETQERERVLVHFSKRYLDCNPGAFNSQDAVHTLTCAIMLLNTDLHGQAINRKMTCGEFIENLAGLNECDNFPRDILKHLYYAIKNYPLEWALDDEGGGGTGGGDETTTPTGGQTIKNANSEHLNLNLKTTNPFLDVPNASNAVEYKKGYVMRKCCYEANAKRTPFHKRGWKMFYCTLRNLILYLHKDENGFRKNQMAGDHLHNAIRIHHSLATKASDYKKKQFVLRLQTADQAEYLFQTSDSKELQSWIDTINFVCTCLSPPPLEAGVGSQKKFQRPLLPCGHTKFNLREQLHDHEERVLRLEGELEEHRSAPPERGAKSLIIQNYREKETYLNFELKRYRTYVYILQTRMTQFQELTVNLVDSCIGEVDNDDDEQSTSTMSSGAEAKRQSPATNRYSYRQAIYSRNMLNSTTDYCNSDRVV